MANQQLVDYVTLSISGGKSREETIKVLLDVGWPREEIEAAFSLIKPGNVENGEEPRVESNPVEKGTFFGDGSWTNVYDLGLPGGEKISHSNPPIAVFGEEKLNRKDDSNWKAEEQKNEKVDAAAAEPGVKSVGSSLNMSFIWIVAAVFLVFVIAGLVWWMLVGRGSGGDFDAGAGNFQSTAMQTDSDTSLPVDSLDVARQDLKLSNQKYSNTNGFEIVPPQGWVIDESGTFGTLVTLSNPIASEDRGNKYAANINVVAEPDQNATMEEYLKSSREILTKTFASYVELSERKLTLGEREAILLEAKYDMGAYSLHNLQLILKVGNRFFVITGTTMETNWEMYKLVIEQSILSFR